MHQLNWFPDCDDPYGHCWISQWNEYQEEYVQVCFHCGYEYDNVECNHIWTKWDPEIKPHHDGPWICIWCQKETS